MKKESMEFIFIIDKSVAMRGLDDTIIREFNSTLEQQCMEGEVFITTVLFDDRYELFHDRISIQAAAPLAREDYTTGGRTALLDAIGRSMHKFRRVRHGTKKDFRAERVVFVIITGSCDNASRSYTEEMIRKRITYRRQKYGWEFVFYGVGMGAVEEAGKTGIAVEWSCNQDTGGLQMAFADISATLTGFRSAGTGGGMGLASADEPVEQILRKHWSSMACLTGRLAYPGSMMSSRGEGDGVPEEELLPGEISASVFRIGCYLIRKAERVYKIHEPGYIPELETPADRDEVREVRDAIKMEGEEMRSEELQSEKLRSEEMPSALSVEVVRKTEKEGWRDRLRLACEISARHYAEPGSSFRNICRCTEASNSSWSERIKGIYTAKENSSIPDEYASLLIWQSYMGSSFSADTWYKLAPTGNITKLSLHPYDMEQENRQFC